MLVTPQSRIIAALWTYTWFPVGAVLSNSFQVLSSRVFGRTWGTAQSSRTFLLFNEVHIPAAYNVSVRCPLYFVQMPAECTPDENIESWKIHTEFLPVGSGMITPHQQQPSCNSISRTFLTYFNAWHFFITVVTQSWNMISANNVKTHTSKYWGPTGRYKLIKEVGKQIMTRNGFLVSWSSRKSQASFE